MFFPSLLLLSFANRVYRGPSKKKVSESISLVQNLVQPHRQNLFLSSFDSDWSLDEFLLLTCFQQPHYEREKRSQDSDGGFLAVLVSYQIRLITIKTLR